MTVEVNNPVDVTAPQASQRAGIGHLAARGMMWMFGQSMISRVITTLTQVVLGWLLTEQHFGRVGLALTVYAFPALLQQSGLRDVLTQRQQRYHQLVTPAFWLALCSGTLAGIIMLVAAPIAQAAYHKDIFGLVALLALAAPLEALATVPFTKLQVELRFRALSSIYLANIGANALLSMLLAWRGYGPYAIILPRVILAGIQAIVLLAWTRPKIRWNPHLQLWRRLLVPLSQLLAISVCNALAAQGDYVALGLFHEEAVVGVYFFAYGIAAQALRYIAGNTHVVLFPALSRLNHSPAAQFEMAFKTMRVMAYVAIPIMLLQGALARPVLTVVFHHKWDAAIPIVQILSIGLSLDAVSWVAGALLQAQGRFRQYLILSFIAAVAFMCVITTAAYFFSAVGVAIGVAVYSVTFSQVFVLSSLRPSDLKRKQIILMYGIPLALGIGSVAIGALVGQLIPDFKGANGVRLIAIASVAAGLYVPLVQRVAPDVVHILRERARNLIRRRLTPAPTGAT